MPDAIELKGDGLLLRPWRIGDAAQVVRIVADSEIARWSGVGTPNPADWCERVSDWSDGTHATWAATSPGGPEDILGYVSLHHLDLDGGDCEVGYWTVAEHRGRGVATRALRCAASYAFDQLGLRRVMLYHAVENAGSCVVATSAGFVLEGTHRQSYRYGDGRWHDEHSHARLRGDPDRGLTSPS